VRREVSHSSVEVGKKTELSAWQHAQVVLWSLSKERPAAQISEHVRPQGLAERAICS